MKVCAEHNYNMYIFRLRLKKSQSPRIKKYKIPWAERMFPPTYESISKYAVSFTIKQFTQNTNRYGYGYGKGYHGYQSVAFAIIFAPFNVLQPHHARYSYARNHSIALAQNTTSLLNVNRVWMPEYDLKQSVWVILLRLTLDIIFRYWRYWYNFKSEERAQAPLLKVNVIVFVFMSSWPPAPHPQK